MYYQLLRLSADPSILDDHGCDVIISGNLEEWSFFKKFTLNAGAVRNGRLTAS